MMSRSSRPSAMICPLSPRVQASPGHAATSRHQYKLRQQYPHRQLGAILVPLVAELGGRWHSSVPLLARRLACEYVARTPSLAGAASTVTARWAARLSALLYRGNAAVVQAAQPAFPVVARGTAASGGGLSHLIPEGDSAYELLVR